VPVRLTCFTSARSFVTGGSTIATYLLRPGSTIHHRTVPWPAVPLRRSHHGVAAHVVRFRIVVMDRLEHRAAAEERLDIRRPSNDDDPVASLG